jgi:hypothetical protein
MAEWGSRRFIISTFYGKRPWKIWCVDHGAMKIESLKSMKLAWTWARLLRRGKP